MDDLLFYLVAAGVAALLAHTARNVIRDQTSPINVVIREIDDHAL